MEILRTPSERFEEISDFPYRENYFTLPEGMRMHYVDEGDKSATTLLLLHGEPSWSYLYRYMIPPLLKAGFRIIAPDLIGFGKSDKLGEANAYSYQNYTDWMNAFLKGLNLRNIILFCQDWGGLIGLRSAIDHSDRFKAVIAGNTFLPAGILSVPTAFEQWKAFAQSVPEFPVAKVIEMGTLRTLSPEDLKAYNAPFPDESYKVAARIFPLLVPTNSEDPEAIKNQNYLKAWKQWNKPFLTLFSDSDPITKGGDLFFQNHIPGAAGMPHATIKEAGHFLQEDKGEEIADKIIHFVKKID